MRPKEAKLMEVEHRMVATELGREGLVIVHKLAVKIQGIAWDCSGGRCGLYWAFAETMRPKCPCVPTFSTQVARIKLPCTSYQFIHVINCGSHFIVSMYIKVSPHILDNSFYLSFSTRLWVLLVCL